MTEDKSYIVRMHNEYVELLNRCEKLEKFINTNEIFPTLNLDKKTVMRRQLDAMRLYAHFLGQRIALEGPEIKKPQNPIVKAK